MTLPVIVVGAGGHAKVVIDTLYAMGRTVHGCTDVDAVRHGYDVLGAPILGDDGMLVDLGPHEVEIALGMGAPTVEVGIRRLALARDLAARGFHFPAVVHPTATVAPDVQVGDGAQIMAGGVVQPGTYIGAFAVVNTRASIDHDGRVEDGAHVAPGAVLGGTVCVGEGALVGLGSSVLPGVSIGAGSTVGAGAVVIRDIPPGARAMGVPVVLESDG